MRLNQLLIDGGIDLAEVNNELTSSIQANAGATPDNPATPYSIASFRQREEADTIASAKPDAVNLPYTGGASTVNLPYTGGASTQNLGETGGASTGNAELTAEEKRQKRMDELKSERESRMSENAKARAASDPMFNPTLRPDAPQLDDGYIRYYAWVGGAGTGSWRLYKEKSDSPKAESAAARALVALLVQIH
jgi:hypothetical protein